MRFFADSPSIPDELLVARDEGRVVFFCGAGVSRACAGLSDFFELAKTVINSLGVTDDDPARRIIEEARELDLRTGISGLISADRVFGLLERNFLSRDIETSVAKALKPPPDVDLSAHRIMLDLARAPDGKYRLVTTNFDLLFESCDSSLKYSCPPQLPDPHRYDEFEGIIHLHGLVDNEYQGAAGDGFVLSSAEFGRAYLSDGWATQFIKAILDNYFVVFVGYAADDPPVLYLLEALNRHFGSMEGVYAFQSGSQSEAEAKWRHKGVQPIAYDDAGEHRILWETLAAWAIRAQDPTAWQDEVICQARKGPEAMPPHQRGQVAHIVSTLEGARKFCCLTDPPPAEWLCVFDSAIRFSKPGHIWKLNEKGLYFDPFKAFGLDSDQIPTPIDPDDIWAKRESPQNAWNAFTATRLDRQKLEENNFAAFRGHWSVNLPSLPPRLLQLGVWLAAIAHQPAAVWWAANQVGIHPDIQYRIIYELERKKKVSSSTVRLAWRYIFEAWETRRNDFRRDWYELKGSISVNGWSSAAIRELARIYRPYLKVGRPYGCGPRPPEDDADTHLRDIVNLNVEYPEPVEEIHIPDEYLLATVREVRKNLEYASTLEKEFGGFGLDHICPIERDPVLQGEESERKYGISRFFFFYLRLVERLAAIDSRAAKDEYLAWWPDDEKIFARLRIWASGQEKLLTGIEAGSVICHLTDDAFWNSRHQRDLMLTIKKRWNDFPKSIRTRLERRLLNGCNRWRGEDKAEFTKHRAWGSLNRIHWLHSQGCQLGFDLQAETVTLQRFAPDWKQQNSEKAAASMEGRGGFVRTDTSFSMLLTVPIGMILTKSREVSGRHHERLLENDPFTGLVSARPVRSFLALIVSAKSGEYPEWAWRKFLQSEARKTDKPRLVAHIAERISRFPSNTVGTILYPASEWLLSAAKILFEHYRKQFENVWIKLMTVLRTHADIANTSIVRTNKLPEWPTEALNAPVGKLAQVIMEDPNKDGLKPRKGFPPGWIKYVEELLELGGDQRRHALVMFAFNLNWFFAVDQTWSETKLMSVLGQENDDEVAFWQGFFWHAQIPNESLYIRLKPYLFNLAKLDRMEKQQDAEILSAILLAGWGSICKRTGERFVTSDEMRDIILKSNDQFRGQVLWQLESWSSEKKGKWVTKVPTFLTEVWPRHKKVKSPSVSGKLCNLAFVNEKIFPLVADAIVPLVTEIDASQIMLPNIRNDRSSIVDKYPEKTLALLSSVLPEKVSAWPYGIEDVITRIEIAAPLLRKDSRLVELKRKWDAR